MARRFNKEIKTEKQIKMYNAINECKNEIKKIEEQVSKALDKCQTFEGKYAKGKMKCPYTDFHFRDWEYWYANEEDRQREQAEEKAYYENTVLPLKNKLAEIKKQYAELQDKLCIDLWGYDVATYERKRQREADIKELNELLERVEYLKKKIAKE